MTGTRFDWRRRQGLKDTPYRIISFCFVIQQESTAIVTILLSLYREGRGSTIVNVSALTNNIEL